MNFPFVLVRAILTRTYLTAAWFPVFTNTTSTNGTFEFSENPLAGGAARFYRATASP